MKLGDKYEFDISLENHYRKNYKSFSILPSIEFDIDTQFSEVIEIGGERIGGVSEYSLIFRMFNFSLHFILTKLS